ncbi:MAG: GNAT family N-acetyltransferase [Verrucomicrobiales bacterium]|nr:GNAT family N-acetyltransferase [Verrucomicrobiales bacterium]
MAELPTEPRRLKNGILRPVTVADAALVVELRSQPRARRFLGHTSGDVDAQRAWLEAYQARHSRGEDYYFRLDDAETGRAAVLFRIYEVVPAQHFTWGSWIAAPDAPAWAAMASWLASFDFGFFQLRCPTAFFRTMTDNVKTLSFMQRFNSKHLHTAEGHEHFSLEAATYYEASLAFQKFFANP